MKGYVNLQNGNMFDGEWAVKPSRPIVLGEVVFFTGMTGYQEVLTDPSYKDQIIVFTYPLIGNYGINEHDFESKKPHVAGVIVYECYDTTFHYEAKHSLTDYLEKWDIPLLTQVDTRALVKQIREDGSMLAQITSNKDHLFTNFDMKTYLVKEVTTSAIETFGDGDEHVVLFDFGNKKSILKSLLNRSCKVTVVPYDTTYEKVKSLKPDGVLLSNGPGDPKQLVKEMPNLRRILETYPCLGICLGHQIVSLAFGGNTKKLLFGHRGANQPVIDLKTKKVCMTSQNHSYVVDEESLKQTDLNVRFKNVNDSSVEGMVHKKLPILSVQFHPEANPGPQDSGWVFDEFLKSVRSVRGEKVYA